MDKAIYGITNEQTIKIVILYLQNKIKYIFIKTNKRFVVPRIENTSHPILIILIDSSGSGYFSY